LWLHPWAVRYPFRLTLRDTIRIATYGTRLKRSYLFLRLGPRSLVRVGRERGEPDCISNVPRWEEHVMQVEGYREGERGWEPTGKS
jgi:hypothetical protein